MSEVGWGRPHPTSDMGTESELEVAYSQSPGQRNPIVSEGEFRLGLQSESELVWGRPHPTSDMDTAPLLEVAYSITALRSN